MKHLSSAILLISLFISCRKTDQPHPGPDPTSSEIIDKENSRLGAVITTQTTTAFLSGTVMDESGKPLAGATIANGISTVTSNAKGYFQFTGSIAFNKDYATIVATLPGYFKGFKTFTPNKSGKANHYLELRLLKEGTAKTVAEIGGTIDLDNKINLSFPPNAVVTATGAAYSGQYKVVARYIDPAVANFSDIMPGQLTGLNDQEQFRSLQSFGMATVEIKDGAGNLLQVAPGKTVTMKLPATAGSPATIPLWHFNEKYGLWIKAGEATKSGDQYITEVNHFSTWNLDLEMNSFRLDVQLNDPAGHSLPGLHGEIGMEGNNKISSFFTDNEGKVSFINCPSSKPLVVKVFLQCDTISTTIEAVNSSRSEIITVPPGSRLKSFAITGKLSGCDNALLPTQPFTLAIKGENGSFTAPLVSDAAGNFSVSGIICNTNNAGFTAQAMTFINGEFRYAPVANLAFPEGVYNAKICDTTDGIADNFEILFPDPGLDDMIRKKINKPAGTLVYGDVKAIDTLQGFNPINDLTGIQFCTNLQVFDLRGGSNLTKLELLGNLVKLRRLYLIEEGTGSITDISPLQHLSLLTDLSLGCPKLTDISPLQQLVNIETLSLVSNGLTNLSPLENLTKLYWLQINSPVLTDLSPLAKLVRLKHFGVFSGALVKGSLDVLKNFTILEDLTISNTTIADFSIVQQLPQLLYLHLDFNQLADLNQFATLKNLVSLEVSSNKITDVTALQGLTQLKYLKLSYNQIADITSLKYLTQAEIISADNNKITDVGPLQNLNSLKILWLHNNQVSNISPLVNGVAGLEVLKINSQVNATISQSQRDAFKASHPTCFMEW